MPEMAPTAVQKSTPAPPSTSAAEAGLSVPLRSTSKDRWSLPPPPVTWAAALPLLGLTGPRRSPLLTPSKATAALT